MTVSMLLGEARRAHLDFRAAVRDGRLSDEKAALKRALASREEAEHIDPAHIDFAWQEDSRQTFGIIAPLPMADLDLHADLLAFYKKELARLTK